MPNNNPTGKGGLQERPQDINRNGRPHEPSIIRIIKEKLTDLSDKQRLDEIFGQAIVKRVFEVLKKPVKGWNASECKLVFEIMHYIDGMPTQKVEQQNTNVEPINLVINGNIENAD